jgi:hypothetical protein
MSALSKKAMWMAVGAGSAMLAGAAVERALGAGWRRVRDEPPPADRDSRDTGWGEALLWTVVTGAAVGGAQLLARRGAAAGWTRVTGKQPPRR